MIWGVNWKRGVFLFSFSCFVNYYYIIVVIIVVVVPLNLILIGWFCVAGFESKVKD